MNTNSKTTTPRAAQADRILVTGASGFLGREVSRTLIESGRKVVAASRSTVGEANSFYDPQAVDLLDPETHAGVVEGVDAVVHAAGLAHQFGGQQPAAEDYHRTNAEVSVRLARAAAKAGVPHFVLISSIAVYGPGDNSRDESSSCCPGTPYAQSKLAAERLVSQALAKTGTRLTVLRIATLYGIDDPGNVGRLMRLIAEGQFVWIGRGLNQKSFLHVDDAATACRKAIESPPATPSAIYNVVGQTVTVRELVETAAGELGVRLPRWSFPAGLACGSTSLAATLTAGWKKPQRVLNALEKWVRDDRYDGRLFQRELGFEPAVSLTVGLREQAAANHPRAEPTANSMSEMGKRCFDLVAATSLLLASAVPMVIIAAAVRLTSRGPAIYTSERVGRNNRLFRMPKFRSMRTDTPEQPTHLLASADRWITPLGRVLRRTSLDELPQLWSILRGEMSFVGPRPALFSQDDLNLLRTESGVCRLTPGLTGWAQVNGRDELSIESKASLDAEYLRRRSLAFDLQILGRTFLKVLQRDGIAQASPMNSTPHQNQAA